MDWCTGFPEKWRGKEIGEPCCKKHDYDSGEEGDFNFIQHQKSFYRCLRTQLLKSKWAIVIAIGGAVGVVLKMPWLLYKKVRYRGWIF